MFEASVIIPTFNRKESLQRTLDSLRHQAMSSSDFEVIVVDDGSTDDTHTIQQLTFPFRLSYVYQTNAGDAAARNTGAQISQARWLVFLDDDVIVDSDYLYQLIKLQGHSNRQIVCGTAFTLFSETAGVLAQFHRTEQCEVSTEQFISFADVASNNMCISRTGYFQVGGMQALDFPGSNIWCDVEFNYRAYLQGWQFKRTSKAICFHDDYVLQDRRAASKRAQESAYRAAWLFEKHPNLIEYIPMFFDKRPISWGDDQFAVVLRKVARRLVSGGPAMRSLETMACHLENRNPGLSSLAVLYRWIIGGYIYRGYRQGLKDLANRS